MLELRPLFSRTSAEPFFEGMPEGTGFGIPQKPCNLVIVQISLDIGKRQFPSSILQQGGIRCPFPIQSSIQGDTMNTQIRRNGIDVKSGG